MDLGGHAGNGGAPGGPRLLLLMMLMLKMLQLLLRCRCVRAKVQTVACPSCGGGARRRQDKSGNLSPSANMSTVAPGTDDMYKYCGGEGGSCISGYCHHHGRQPRERGRERGEKGGEKGSEGGRLGMSLGCVFSIGREFGRTLRREHPPPPPRALSSPRESSTNKSAESGIQGGPDGWLMSCGAKHTGARCEGCVKQGSEDP